MRDDLTICIPTIAGRERLLERARASAEGQARVLVQDGGTTPGDYAYALWWQAVYAAQTPYVALLHDDDWYEPNFADRCMEMMRPECAYVLSDGVLHYPDGRVDRNLRWDRGGYCTSTEMEQTLFRMDYTISPSAAVFRRADLLRNLFVGGVPVVPRTEMVAGCDLLLMLLPLLEYPVVGFVGEALAHFDAGPQSTTIHALETPEGTRKLRDSYVKARLFYTIIRHGISGVIANA